MTQEEKAKAYDIALDKIKRLLGTGSNCSREDLEYVFPELKESEDERIRKNIISYLALYKDVIGEEYESWLAWLEKQGEQKPANWFQELEDKLANATPQQLAEWKEKYFKEEPVSEPNKELAETYLAVFNKKFPILPSLNGKQLADYKDFLNKCQQIFGLKEWGIRPIQSKLFEKLSLLWAAWGAEHLQEVGMQDEKEQDIPASEELEKAVKKEAEIVNALGGEFPPNPLDMELIKTIFIHGANWQKKQKNIWHTMNETPNYPCDILFITNVNNMFLYRYMENGRPVDKDTPYFNNILDGKYWYYCSDIIND